MRQAKARTARRKPYKSRLKTELKKVMLLAKSNPEAAKKALPVVYSVIDTAAKKNLIHKNNAARKKSNMAKLVEKAAKGEVMGADAAQKTAKVVKKSAGGKKKASKK